MCVHCICVSGHLFWSTASDNSNALVWHLRNRTSVILYRLLGNEYWRTPVNDMSRYSRTGRDNSCSDDIFVFEMSSFRIVTYTNSGTCKILSLTQWLKLSSCNLGKHFKKSVSYSGFSDKSRRVTAGNGASGRKILRFLPWRSIVFYIFGAAMF